MMPSQHTSNRPQDLRGDLLWKLRAQDLTRANAVEPLFTLLATYEAKGYILDMKLEQALRMLPDYPIDEFEEQVSSVGLELLNSFVTYDETISPPEPEPMVNPKQVFDSLADTNPFFQRWLEFRSLRPAPDPESWDEFSEERVAKEDQDYARAMREVGQMLVSLIHRKKQIAEYIATSLKNSHKLPGPARYWNTLSWVYMAEEDAEK
ncbi:MAG TPA: hypothetical protein VGM27_33795 [Acidobacteriaceae bacterium]|jgi:hypothetical protein